uniref:FERM domain-containing protein n=1 Tax=Macrostomum lignano TaxID=282301 RepID=A0A1I8FPM6_9PLAT
EIGDFLEEEYLDTLYLTRLKVLPSPVSEELLKKVMEYHKAHVGLTPEDAEYSLLDTVRKVDLYGIRLHPARSFYKDAVDFYFDSRVECKHFWKKCIEHHTHLLQVGQSARPLGSGPGIKLCRRDASF